MNIKLVETVGERNITNTEQFTFKLIKLCQELLVDDFVCQYETPRRALEYGTCFAAFMYKVPY